MVGPTSGLRFVPAAVPDLPPVPPLAGPEYAGPLSLSSLKFLEWPKQQRHYEDHYKLSKYEQYQTVL